MSRSGVTPTPAFRRLWKRFVVSDNGCWEVSGSRDGYGYGRINDGGRPRNTHIVLWEALYGPVPEGMELDHLCRNPACLRPDHLEPVTHLENVRRGDCGRHNTVKTHCPGGHEYSPENTYIDPKGSRVCRACRVLHNGAYRRRRAHGQSPEEAS